MDPITEEVVFIRSDQFPFVQSGVPAIYLGTGSRSTDSAIDLNAREQEFLRTRYHKPTDDLMQPIDWESTAAFADVAAAFTRAVAEDRRAPAWYEGDFFGHKFGGDAPRAPKPASGSR